MPGCSNPGSVRAKCLVRDHGSHTYLRMLRMLRKPRKRTGVNLVDVSLRAVLGELSERPTEVREALLSVADGHAVEGVGEAAAEDAIVEAAAESIHFKMACQSALKMTI